MFKRLMDRERRGGWTEAEKREVARLRGEPWPGVRVVLTDGRVGVVDHVDSYNGSSWWIVFEEHQPMESVASTSLSVCV